MIEKTGVPSKNMILECFPEESVLYKPKAIIECYKEIPCNPCSTSCPFDAIFIPEDINKRPEIDFNKCTGCGICLHHCPGLAITVRQIKNDKALLKIPYEFVPYPKVGTVLKVMNRAGEHITDGIISKVQYTEKQNKTAILHLLVDKAYLYDAITVEVPYGQK
ncbi:MAG: 4Fe-4S binding protein [Bacillota bacterium]